MNIIEAQNCVKEFNDKRNWSIDNYKDLLLNMNEEIGEIWNIIKWVDIEKQKQLIKENKSEAENFIGDMFYLVFKLGYLWDINPEKSFKEVMEEYEKRFPVKETLKRKHANKLAGGIDLKYD